MNAIYRTLAIFTGLALLSSSLVAQEPIIDERPMQSAEYGLEENLGLDFYRPTNMSVTALIRVIRPITETQVRFYRQSTDGRPMNVISRDRFVQIGYEIGIQDFPEGRAKAIELLARIDGHLEEQTQGQTASQDESETSTVYAAKAIGVLRIADILATQLPNLTVTPVSDSGMVILRGQRDSVHQALALLEDVDRPGIQFMLTCYLVSTEGGNGGRALPEELVRGLGELLPGATFSSLGQSMVRGSISHGSRLQFETELAQGPDATAGQLAPRFAMKAIPGAYDKESKKMTLSTCSFDFRTSRTQSMVNGAGQAQTSHSGWDSERLETDLVLQKGEFAVVGALGAQQKLIVLRFEPIESL